MIHVICNGNKIHNVDYVSYDTGSKIIAIVIHIVVRFGGQCLEAAQRPVVYVTIFQNNHHKNTSPLL